MLYIVVTACLLSNPSDCAERHIPVYADVSLMGCMMGAQGEIARWRELHADLRVARWRCQTDAEILASNG